MIESGKFYRFFIYFIRSDKSVLRVGTKELPTTVLDELIENNGVIIWENRGNFRLLPISILRNVQLSQEATQQLKENYPLVAWSGTLRGISREQATPVTFEMVRYLLTSDNSRDSLSDPDSTPKTESKDQASNP